jgi:tRNA-dihydrouridine synthase B
MHIRPLKVGQLQLANNLIQGPLAGYSCAPFRLITHRLGHPAYCSTEMISAKDLAHRAVKPKRYIWKAPAEGLVSYQLSGDSAKDLAVAARIVTDVGASLIDLNCGCPVAKIRAKGAGSKLLTEPSKIHDLVKALKANTSVPVSVKVRIDANSSDKNNLLVVKAIEEAGADLLVVHGRHWTEKYDVPCNLAQIAEIAAVSSIPVIANGDIEDLASLKRTFELTNCAGIMIARASVGQPWLFKKLSTEVAGAIFHLPSLVEIGQFYFEHVKGLVDLENEFLAVMQARKLAKYYIRQHFDNTNFLLEVNTCKTLAKLAKLIEKYFI